MGEKDITEKILLAFNDVFSDIVNVLLFAGKKVISAEELEEQTPRSAYKTDEKKGILRAINSKMQHPKEVLQLIDVMTKDHRMEEAYNEVEIEGGADTMNEFIDKLEARGEARGKILGEIKGRICAIIELGEDLGMQPGAIIKTLQEKMKVDQQQATEYYNQYARKIVV